MKKEEEPVTFKALKVLTLFTLILFAVLSSSCVSGMPPSSYVINPVVISNGAGGQFVASQNNYGKGPISRLEKIGSDGQTQWQVMQLDPSPPFKPYTSSPTDLVSDGKGNLLVAWGLDDKIWANKLDINSNSVWKDKVKMGSCNRLYNLKAISDGSGGMIVGYFGQSGEFGLQHVSGDGILLWPEKRMSNVPGFEFISNAWVMFYYSMLLWSVLFICRKSINLETMFGNHHCY
jgi:hypothetical protein